MELHHSVAEFFREALTAALKAKHVRAAEVTEFYLVNLLADFARVAHLDDEPLALKLAQAAAASRDERARALKDVGDTSLYVSGFFADSLAGKLVDVDYYISLGGSAYAQLSGLVAGMRGASTDTFRVVYDELAERFTDFVGVLGEIRAHTHIASSTNLVRLCEEWVRTRSDWSEKRLRASGLIALDALKNGKLPE